MRIRFFTLLIIMVVLGIGSYGIANAFFTSSATSQNNTFATAATFPTGTPSATVTPTTTPTPTPQIADHLVINEVMSDPPNSNACGNENDAAWVEIFNPTSSTVNLDTWLVGDTTNTDDLPNVSLPAGGYAVVSDCTQSSFNSIWPLASGTVYIDISTTIGNGFNNGGEHIRLLNGATLVDAMSYGTNTTAFSPSVPAPAANHSAERNPDGIDTNTASDFVDRNTPTPGS